LKVTEGNWKVHWGASQLLQIHLLLLLLRWLCDADLAKVNQEVLPAGSDGLLQLLLLQWHKHLAIKALPA
jgi:hypothetical protein